MDEILLEAESLRVYFPSKSGMVRAVEDVSFRVMAGETFGIIGESGCGKTTTGRALTGLIRPTGGQVRLCGRPLESGSRMERAGQIQMVFQDSQGALDPRYTVGRTIGEPLAVHRQGTAAQRRARTLALMADVGLSPQLYDRYPHALSGGQRQRVGVARALALSPRVVVCDEPVSALDVSIQAQILALMAHLQGKYGLTYVFISHNLSVVRLICNRVAVMYLGRIVELGQREDIFQRAAHPYTAALLSAIPDPDPDAPQGGRVLEGDVPSPVNPPAGCVFHTRCTRCAQACTVQPPPLRELAAGHWVACHFPEGV